MCKFVTYFNSDEMSVHVPKPQFHQNPGVELLQTCAKMDSLAVQTDPAVSTTATNATAMRTVRMAAMNEAATVGVSVSLVIPAIAFSPMSKTSPLAPRTELFPVFMSLVHTVCLFTVCIEGQFDCGDGQCIYDDFVCDGEPNCINGADETVCGVATPPR